MSRYAQRPRTRTKQYDDYLNPDKECKNCKSNSKNKPDLILKINICGHSYCTDCILSVFKHGEAACLIDNCGFRLKQAKFRPREFKDETTDKEMHFRKLLEKTYNKQPDEFETTAQYNQYLEEKEDKIYKFTYGDRERMKSILKEIEEYEKENRKNIRKNNDELSRKRKEKKIEIEKNIQYEEHILQKHREEDQAKLSKNSISKHDVDLINKIEKEAKADLENIVVQHQKQQKEIQEREEKLKKEQEEEARKKLEQENGNNGAGFVQKRGNIRGFLNRKKFDSEMETRKIEEPWEYRYSSSFLPRVKTGFPRIRTKEDIKIAGYDMLVPVSDLLKEWAGSNNNVDKTSIAQRQVNDAMTCL